MSNRRKSVALRDSFFFVANASYVAAQTGTGAPGAFLVNTGGKRQHRDRQRHPGAVGAPPRP